MTFNPQKIELDAKLFQNQNGYYGYGTENEFGGRFVPEILLPALQELESIFNKYKEDPDFETELLMYQKDFIGRPSPLIFAENLTKSINGAQIYLKNEGNNLTGSHKINHCLYQVLLAKRMGKKRVICETGAGQHGVATATVCAKFGLECFVYIGQNDLERQYSNVFLMKQLGAKIISVTVGRAGLSEAVDAALGDFITNPDSYYMLGSALGPTPYPEIIREAQSIISKESRYQLQERIGKLPDIVIACIGGGSNAIGAFNEYLMEEKVKLLGVEAGGMGVFEAGSIGKHASRIHSGLARKGIMQGFKSLFLLDENGMSLPSSTIAVGLNYPGIGPIHAYLYEIGRLEITSVTNVQAIEAFQEIAQKEGLLIALESAHAISAGIARAKELTKDKVVLINVSGRGDNYIFNLAKSLKDKEFESFCNEFKL